MIDTVRMCSPNRNDATSASEYVDGAGL